VALTDGEQVAFACQPCGCCWQFGLGWACEVDRRGLRRVVDESHRVLGPPGAGTPAHGHESITAGTAMRGDEE